MEREQYDLMFHQEEHHWWYVGMRRISEVLLARHFHPDNARPDVLDAGCGSGGTTVWLRRWGRVTAVDLMPEAVALAHQRGIKQLARASIQALPFASESFDLLTCFDVLYHLRVDDDAAALAEFHRVLRPGGLALIRVAALDWLRGTHDRAVHTRHRYGRDELAHKLRAASFVVERASYANFFVFPLAPAKRLLEHGSATASTDLWQPPAPVNRLLAHLLGLEAGLIVDHGLPWGLSTIAVARKPLVAPRQQPEPVPQVLSHRSE